MAVARFTDLTALEVRALARNSAIALYLFGSTEQQGTHLTTGFHFATITAVYKRATATATQYVLLLSGLALGSSDHHMPMGETVLLR